MEALTITDHLQPDTPSKKLNDKRVIDDILSQLIPINNPRIMVQIGASDGKYARRFAASGWNVYAFDANPKYRFVEDESKSNPQSGFNFFNQAVALNEEEFVTFYVSKKHPGISSLNYRHETHESVQVRATTLRKFYESYRINSIDFFMVDAETLDLEIMKTHDWNVPITALMMECNR